MANASIASNRLQALKIALDIPTQIAFNQQSTSVDCMDDLAQLFRRKIFCANIGIDVGLL